MPYEFTLLGIFLIVYLYFPGFIFKRFYFNGPFTKQFRWGSMPSKFSTGLLAGILLHSLVIAAIGVIRGISINSTDIDKCLSEYNTFIARIQLVSKGKADLKMDEIVTILAYWLMICAISAMLGLLAYKIIQIASLDLKYKILTYKNSWHYYFKGRSLREFAINKKSNLKYLGTHLDVLVQTPTENIQYTGFLINYNLSTVECQIENICLADTYRRVGSYKMLEQVKGDYFFIPFKDVLNINIRHVKAKKAKGPFKLSRWMRIATMSSFFLSCILLFLTVSRFNYSQVGFKGSFITTVLSILDILAIIGLLAAFRLYRKKEENKAISLKIRRSFERLNRNNPSIPKSLLRPQNQSFNDWSNKKALVGVIMMFIIAFGILSVLIYQRLR